MLTPNLNKNTLKQILFHKLMKNTLFCCVFLASALSNTAQVLISGFSPGEYPATASGVAVNWPESAYSPPPNAYMRQNPDGTQTSILDGDGWYYVEIHRTEPIDATDCGHNNAFLIRAKVGGFPDNLLYDQLIMNVHLQSGGTTIFTIPMDDFIFNEFRNVIVPFADYKFTTVFVSSERFTEIDSISIRVPMGDKYTWRITWDTLSAINIPEPKRGPILVGGCLVGAFLIKAATKHFCTRT